MQGSLWLEAPCQSACKILVIPLVLKLVCKEFHDCLHSVSDHVDVLNNNINGELNLHCSLTFWSKEVVLASFCVRPIATSPLTQSANSWSLPIRSVAAACLRASHIYCNKSAGDSRRLSFIYRLVNKVFSCSRSLELSALASSVILSSIFFLRKFG